jgi:glycosyltransferase involved in cell wall biosynthesis
VKPAMSVVIPTHNRSASLARVLEAYEEQVGDTSFELLVADDGSTDGTAGFVQASRSRRYHLRSIVLPQNQGPGQARNAALAAAGAALVLIAGDDILPSRDFLARHLEAHERDPASNRAILGLTTWASDLHVNSLMRHIDGRGGQQFGYAHLRDGQEVDFRHFYTSNVSFKKEILGRLDRWFDPDFVFPAYEDAELAYRLSRRCGLRIRFEASAHATHSHSYDTRAFSERQYRCGLMAIVMLRKHPELRTLWRTGRLTRTEVLASARPLRVPLDKLREDEVRAAEDLAINLGAECEELDRPIVDPLYSVLLEYFVLKGMLVGKLGQDRARRPSRALLIFGLLHHLRVLIQGPGGFSLASLDSGRAVVRTAEHYDDILRKWPRALRWPMLAPLRAMVAPSY